MRVHDISQPVDPATAVWPGDVPVELDWTMRRDRGDTVNVAAVRLSMHAGTHADGPYHVVDDGARAGGLPLEAYIGDARVIDAVGRAELNESLLDGVDVPAAPRILFRTRARVDERVFPEDFAAVTPVLARRLVEAGARLIGTDAPSVDPFGSTELEAHRVLIGGGVAILENLVLSAVAPGGYTLVAPPLRVVAADSAPVRAVLLELAQG